MSKELEKRLANTEMALHALWTLLSDTVPPTYSEDITSMMSEYWECNKSLGSEVPIEFHRE
jgi:hypothetical protein